ncbi:hypothetical protein KL942_005361 [Ogataea angusta]|uniref:Uncharacterized protein n=1 Tax=Pichia angusta TaxID=870730 RepID=A0ABQ7RPN7_PICAN|nr:hypothetical protein KL942_005361 [Ogataea angusta]KAG7845043.1 hypothetical protein KL940_005277 [Ogataea angusta]
MPYRPSTSAKIRISTIPTKSRKAHGQAAAEMHEPVEQRVVSAGTEASGDQHGHDKPVHGQNAAHDDGDERSHDQFWLERADSRDSYARLGGADCCAGAAQNHRGAAAGEPKERRKGGRVFGLGQCRPGVSGRGGILTF